MGMDFSTRSTSTAKADVVVVGGGIAGTSATYHLASRGADVVLMERGSVGGGATAAAVGDEPVAEAARRLSEALASFLGLCPDFPVHGNQGSHIAEKLLKQTHRVTP